jgi:hypothetical protein
MTDSPSPHLSSDLALARTVRARAPGAWRPNWGRIAALGFCLGVWGLIGWAIAAVFGASS